jgi:cell division septal protein FtsQ
VSAVHTSPDRRFRRVHVTPSRRRRQAAARRRFVGRTLMVALASVGVFQLAGQVSTAEFLQVDTVIVQGNRRLSGGEVLAMMGTLRGQNILTLDLDRYRELLHSSGWIDTATLRRLLPSTLEIRVVERVPAAVARFGSRLYLIDDAGEVIDQLGPGIPGIGLPIVDGLSGMGDGVLADDTRRLELVSNLLRSLATAPDVLALVSQIRVTDPYDAVVMLSDDSTLVRLGHEQFSQRLRRYVELAPMLRERVAAVDYVDMRFEHRVVMRATDSTDRTSGRARSSVARTLRIQ